MEEIIFKETIESIYSYIEKTQSLIDQLFSMDLPNRFDKLVNDVFEIDYAIKNVAKSIGDLRETISKRLNDLVETQSTSFINLQGNLNDRFESLENKIATNDKKNQINFYITWAIVVAGFAALYFLK